MQTLFRPRRGHIETCTWNLVQFACPAGRGPRFGRGRGRGLWLGRGTGRGLGLALGLALGIALCRGGHEPPRESPHVGLWLVTLVLRSTAVAVRLLQCIHMTEIPRSGTGPHMAMGVHQ